MQQAYTTTQKTTVGTAGKWLMRNPDKIILSSQDVEEPPPREQIKHLLIGSSKTVSSTIHYLQLIGYAQVGDWSPLLPTSNPGEVMSILCRYIIVH